MNKKINIVKLLKTIGYKNEKTMATKMLNTRGIKAENGMIDTEDALDILDSIRMSLSPYAEKAKEFIGRITEDRLLKKHNETLFQETVVTEKIVISPYVKAKVLDDLIKEALSAKDVDFVQHVNKKIKKYEKAVQKRKAKKLKEETLNQSTEQVTEQE